MKVYPAMLCLEGKSAVVVGGGKVAERKIRTLLEAGALVTVISPEVTMQIAAWADSGVITWVERKFCEKTDVQEAFLIIAASNDQKVNKQVFHAANPQQLINVADCPEESNFIVPASFKQGRLIISVSTSGASPGLAAKIKNDLAKQYDETFANYADFLADCRQIVKEQISNQERRNEIFQKLLDEKFLRLTGSGDFSSREQFFQEMLKEGLLDKRSQKG